MPGFDEEYDIRYEEAGNALLAGTEMAPTSQQTPEPSFVSSRVSSLKSIRFRVGRTVTGVAAVG